MKSLAARVVAAVLGVLVVAMLAGAAVKSAAPVLHPDKLVILSTVDVKGKTSPCG